MDKTYKAVPYKPGNGENTYEERFCIVSTETGEILDDAQGYGYKTAQKAYAAWAYKNRDRKKDKEKQKKERHIRKWLREHGDFAEAMEDAAFEVEKGALGPDEKFDAAKVRELLQSAGIEVDFTAGELLKVWKNT